MPLKAAIIVLNWNGWRDTIECLESLSRLTFSSFRIVVVDNGSKDESIEKIREFFKGATAVPSKYFQYDRSGKSISFVEISTNEAENKNFDWKSLPILEDQPLYLIKNETNLGFAEGNNIGIRFALKHLNPDYILLLNNDTVVHPDFLTELVIACERDSSIAFAGPKVYYYNANGKSDIIDFAGGTIWMGLGLTTHIGRGTVDRGQYDEIKEVDYVEGSCLLGRKTAIEQIGLMNPDYFLYWEETDWCVRAKRAGYRLTYVPTAKIWHKGAGAGYSKTKSYYLTRNRFIFMRKYATGMQYFIFLLFFALIYFWYFSCLILVVERDSGSYFSFISGIKDGLQSPLK
jgi:GT2 family glycosyltransferase